MSLDSLDIISRSFKKLNFIESAKVYGSFLYSKDSIDCDIAVMVHSKNSIVDQSIYKQLRKLRHKLSTLLKIDVDIVPHTADEVKNTKSPLWSPKNNPSLSFGVDIKNKFPVPDFSSICSLSLTAANGALFLLQENRTILRRQVLRSIKNEEMRIFIAKISHGPGNTLTYLSLKNKGSYKTDPSNTLQSFKAFDAVYNLDSRRVLTYIKKSKQIISKNGQLPLHRALKILSWYETLTATVLNNKPFLLRNFLKNEFK